MREWPVKYLWYGKHAYRPLEEIIDKWPDYFIWMVEKFQDVLPSQASYFQEKWGMDLPSEVIRDVPPYEYKKGSPDGEYEMVCMFDHLPPFNDDEINRYRNREK